MMASIPNTRSAPLPSPTAKAPATGETAPGDFASQLTELRGQPVEASPPPVQAPVTGGELILPESGESVATGEDDETADTPATGAPAIVPPFLPAQPIVSGPQLAATVSADGTAPVEGEEHQALPGTLKQTGDTGKTGLPQPAGADAPKPQVAAPPAGEAAPADKSGIEDPRLEAAIKDLILRKQEQTKQAADGTRNGRVRAAVGATPEAVSAAGQAAPAQPQSPAAAQAPAAPVLPTAGGEQVHSGLAPTVTTAPLQAAAGDKAAPARGTEFSAEQLDMTQDAEWLDRLARDIAQAGSRDAPLRFRLHPQTLGHLHVELQQGDHGTAVRLTVETEAARQLLTDAQPRLAAEARAQGVRLAETHVDLSGSGRHAPGDQRRQDEARQTPFIRTARGAGPETTVAARTPASARLDRYA